MSHAYKINPDFQKEVLASIVGGIYFMLSNQIEEFISVVGYLLIGWYIFWDAVLFDLIVHPWHNQPDIYFIYVLVDSASFAYLFFNMYVEKIFTGRIFLTLLTNFLIVWYLAYSIIDIFVPAQYAPNNSSALFNLFMLVLSTLTAALIVYGEVQKIYSKLEK